MDWKSRVRAVFTEVSHTPTDDVVEELAQHASTMYETARARGDSHDEADRRVARQLECWRVDAGALRRRPRRTAAIVPPPIVPSSRLTGLLHDIRYAARLVRRQPRHALLAIATLALGIGATTTVFSVTHGVLMKPLPWPHADRIVMLTETRGGTPPRFGAFTNAAYLAWHEDAGTLDAIAAWSRRAVTLTGAGEPARLRITAATASLFPVLGAHAIIGSLFEPHDESSAVVVLSERVWRARFGADPAIVGRTVRLDDQLHTVVGVLPDAMAFPDRDTGAIVPFAVRSTTGNQLSMFNAIAMLSPGVTAAQAGAEGTARGAFATDTGMTTIAVFGNDGPVGIRAQPLHDALTADVRRPLIALLVAVGLLFVTVVANVANLQLARMSGRNREMAIRGALGAGAGRVMRQLLIESLLVGIAGGGAGLGLAALLRRAMPSLLPADFPRVDALSVDATVLMFAVVVSICASVAVGLLPAIHVRRLALIDVLTEDSTAPVGAGVRTRTARTRMAVMSAQVAITCVLLVGGSLLGRSFLALANADRGFDPAGVLSAQLSMPATVFPEPAQRMAVINDILERLAAIPSVTDPTFTSEVPLTPGGSTSAFTIRPQRARADVVTAQAAPRVVGQRYFSALGIRTVAGRTFSDADTTSSDPVVVVNEAFARRYLDVAPVGWRLPVTGYASAYDAGIESTVIGVVADARYVTAGDSTQPELYYCHCQMGGGLPVQTVTLLARTAGDPAAAAGALRAAVRDADARLAPDVVMPLERRVLMTLARPRLYAVLLGGFAIVALVVAAVGLFGVLSYTVSQRSRELALRAALGARRVDILRLVLRHGLQVIVTGLTVGMLTSALLVRSLSAQLYGVAPHDALTFAAVPALLLAVGTLACVLPARRAANLEPLRVLRGD